MANTLEIDHKEMHDIKSAAEASGYSRDHVTSLARAKKIVAAQIGRQWYVDLESLLQYANITTLEQQVKQKHLSDDRKAAREISKKLDAQKKRRGEGVDVHHVTAKRAMVALSIAFMFTLGVLGAGGPIAFELLAPQTATSKLATVPVEDTDRPVPTVLLGEEAFSVETTFSEEGVSVHELAAANEAIVLLPEMGVASTSLFSDEVEIATSSDGLRRIVPKDRSVEEGVPFVAVPVREVLVP